MRQADTQPWLHDHTFGQDLQRPAERRTRQVVILTVVTMIVEIVAGLLFGSMALLADGLHMASHAAALGLSVFAYTYARRHSQDVRFSFGTGKVNALAGFTGAILLAGFALFMVVESVQRFLTPVSINYDYAIVVAVVGLIVNGASVLLLGSHGHDHEHGHDGHDHGHDHNLRSAYLHVLADALTSLLAIGALLAGRFYGLSWLDPAMGIVGALLVAKWSQGLLRQTAHVLLDHQIPADDLQRVHQALESEAGVRVEDLHVWSIGPGIAAAEIVLVVTEPRAPEHYKTLIPAELGVQHSTVEVILDVERAHQFTTSEMSRRTV